jgi:hypothetical protein
MFNYPALRNLSSESKSYYENFYIHRSPKGISKLGDEIEKGDLIQMKFMYEGLEFTFIQHLDVVQYCTDQYFASLFTDSEIDDLQMNLPKRIKDVMLKLVREHNDV